MGLAGIQHCVHPRNLTWNLKIMVSKWTFLFQGLIFRFHVKFWDFGGVHLMPLYAVSNPAACQTPAPDTASLQVHSTRPIWRFWQSEATCTHIFRDTKNQHKNLQTTRESQFFFRFWKQYSMPMDEFILLPGVFISRSWKSTASNSSFVVVDGLFLSAKWYVFLMRNHFTLSHFYQSKIDTVNPSEV